MIDEIKDIISKEVMKAYDSGPLACPPSRLLYIPKRSYNNLYGPGTWEFGGELLKEFTIPLRYIQLPENDISPLIPTNAFAIPIESYYELMGNIYLYIGYVHHVLMKHSKKFLAGEYLDILKEFQTFSLNQTVFSYKIPRAFICRWDSTFAGNLAKRIAVYNSISLEEAAKFKINSPTSKFFIDKALTPEVVPKLYFIAKSECLEVNKNYTSMVYLNCIYSLIIEGCYEIHKR